MKYIKLTFSKILDFIKNHIRLFISVICIFLLACAISWSIDLIHDLIPRPSVPKLVTQEELQDNLALQKKLSVSPQQSKEIIEKVQYIQSREESPVDTTYIQSPSLQQGSEKVIKLIEQKSNSLPQSAIQQTDRTVVTPNSDKQKIDVYKINLSPKKLQNISYYIGTDRKTNQGIVQYSLDKRITENGHYIRYSTGYDIKHHEGLIGVGYTW